MSTLPRMSCHAILLGLFPLIAFGNPPDDEFVGFPISKKLEPMVIPVTVGGESYGFLVDTGCSSTVIDKSLASVLGDVVESRTFTTPAGPKEFQVAIPKAISVGQFPLGTDTPVVLHDMTQHREALGLDIRGCLGMDFLSQHIVRIDLDQGRLSLLRSVGPAAGQRIPLKMKGNIPGLEVNVTDAASPEWFLIDTGHVCLNSGRLSPELISQLEQAGKVRLVNACNVGAAGGQIEMKQYFLQNLRLGQFEHKGLLVVSARDWNAFSLDFCARYVATFDFPNGAVYLQPSKRHTSEDEVCASGLAIRRREGKTVVEGVREGSPAAKAGLSRGDELLSIDGHKASEEACLVSLGRLLSGSGRTVRVIIRRGQETQEVGLQLDIAWSVPVRQQGTSQ